ncbi:hypothetical protein H9L39_03411 [Fusarium oxysporum f. sp. albedinis]|nr:hypothetical protein H9L39_03411 [Fusarium oxysporum f. sp. albedinis]
MEKTPIAIINEQTQPAAALAELRGGGQQQGATRPIVNQRQLVLLLLNSNCKAKHKHKQGSPCLGPHPTR